MNQDPVTQTGSSRTRFAGNAGDVHDASHAANVDDGKISERVVHFNDLSRDAQTHDSLQSSQV